MATIFVSHSSRDDALASTVEAWLKRQGFDDIFADHDSIRSGDKWTETLRRVGSSCRVVLSLVTPDWLASSECFGEFAAGWYAGRRMIPLLCVAGATLDDTQDQRLARVLLEDQGVDISRAGAPLALNFDEHPEVTAPFIEGLRAAGALAKVGLDPSVFPADDRRDPEGNLLKPPFPGLESFGDTDADAAIFYGRSSEIAQVLEDLREFRASGDRLAHALPGVCDRGSVWLGQVVTPQSRCVAARAARARVGRAAQFPSGSGPAPQFRRGFGKTHRRAECHRGSRGNPRPFAQLLAKRKNQRQQCPCRLVEKFAC